MSLDKRYSLWRSLYRIDYIHSTSTEPASMFIECSDLTIKDSHDSIIYVDGATIDLRAHIIEIVKYNLATGEFINNWINPAYKNKRW